MQANDILHKQIKHLSVILIEVLRHEIEKYTKSKESEIVHKHRCQTIMHQLLSIANWINKFNPEIINSSDLRVPIDLEKFHEMVTKAFTEMSEAVYQPPNNLNGQKKMNKNESESVLSKLDRYLMKNKDSGNKIDVSNLK
jgi:hypothetical protein